MKLAPVLVAFVILGGTLLIRCPAASAEAQPIPSIKLKFDSDNFTAEYVDAGPAILQVTGQISMDKLPVEKGVMVLWTWIDAGWSHSVIPSCMVFTSTTPQPFSVTVVVPRGTPHNLSATLQVFARWSGKSSIASASTTINVGPLYGVHVVLRRSVEEADQGHPPRFIAVVTNTGTAMDTYRCSLEYTGGLDMIRWFYDANRTVLQDVAPLESRTISFIGRFNEDGNPTENGISVERFPITSMNARDFDQYVRADVVLTVHEKPSWIFWADVPMVAVILWAAVMCAIIVSVVRTRKNRKSLRAPVVKEVGGNDRL
jgi:hypothetical protein